MHRCRFGIIIIAIVLAAGAYVGQPRAADPASREYTGKVISLVQALDKLGVKLDKDAAPASLALVTDSGKIYPLIKDSGSRMFFKDKHLLDRPMRVTGRLFDEPRMLQVVSVRSLVDGVLHEPHYWCDVCKIKRFEPNPCDCCGAPLEFREIPVSK